MKAWFGRLCCRLGFHGWEFDHAWGPIEVNRCRRCGECYERPRYW